MSPLIFLVIVGSVLLVAGLVIAYIGLTAKRELERPYRQRGYDESRYADERLLTR